ncbi:MAG TPA: hypothetical protein VK534_02310 [Methylomirabilota bacterium]|nr:hypothetical protein [Methylomirabilota bacterium]
MTEISEKSHFSREALDAGDRIGSIPVVGSLLRELSSGSNSPAATRATWFKIDNDPKYLDTTTVSGDKRAGRLPRNWNTAAVFSIPERYMDVKEDFQDGVPAVAYVSDGGVRVGVLPKDEDFNFIEQRYGRYQMAMRLGRGPLTASMGLWRPEANDLLTMSIFVDEPSIDIDFLPRRFPHTPLIV